MHTRQRPHEGAGIRERLTQWRLPLTLLCLTVAALAFLWALPGVLFRSAAGSSPNSTTPRTKPIEQIVPGDLVLARDPETGETRTKKVLRVFRNVSDHLRLLTVRNAHGTSQVLRTTDGHPFWVPNRGWTAAAELQVGDELVHADGQPATLVATTYEAHPEGVPIFNFEVEGFHTYFVAAHGTRAPPILVHNTSPGSNPTPENLSRGVPDPSTPVGRRGSPLGSVQGNAPTTIGGRQYSGHAIDQMQARGIPPSVVENTIQHGVPGRPQPVGSGTTSHFDPVNNITVITDTASGRVVTVFPGR